MRRLALVLAAAAAASACGPDAVDEPGIEPGPDIDADPGVAAPDAAESADAASGASVDGGRPSDGIAFSDAVFAGTHNSYMGGERGSLASQLAGGARAVELDFHDNDFAASGYQVGHDEPGDQVALGGDNPPDADLDPWLAAVAAWSADNPDHAPITVVLDVKDPLDDNPGYADGNLARLNEIVQGAFGDRLYPAASAGSALPTIGELRGRVLAVLSGDEGTRLAYRRDRGANAAVAIDATGRVVEVHDSGGGELWYWTGQIEGGGVVWHRHARYDTGEDPAVALSDDGLVVEVHEDPDPDDDTLWYRVGQLGADLDITWHEGDSSGGGIQFPGGDSGVDPSVRFVGSDGVSLREIHRSENDGDPFYWDGAYDAGTRRIEWTRESGASDGSTTDEPFDTAKDAAGEHAIEVSVGEIAPYGADTLRYRTGATWRAIRYRQVLFAEVQHGGDAALAQDDLWFFAAPADSDAGRDRAIQWRRDGRLARLWQFNSPDFIARTPVNILATDTPGATWFRDYCDSVPCLE